MLKFREIKTGSGNTAVQVYYLRNRKRIIVKHIGSATNRDELHNLKQQAQGGYSGLLQSNLPFSILEVGNLCLS
jgi:hypothetical protein